MRGRPGLRRKITEHVPEHMLGAFVEAEFVSELYGRWESHACDMLPQSEGVFNGDWQDSGYDMDKKFPMVLMLLANNYGNEWEAFLSRRGCQSDTVWIIDDDLDCDDFQALLVDFVDDRWFDIETKDAVEKAIEEFQDIVRKSTLRHAFAFGDLPPGVKG